MEGDSKAAVRACPLRFSVSLTRLSYSLKTALPQGFGAIRRLNVLAMIRFSSSHPPQRFP
jgi:hypothetical protein